MAGDRYDVRALVLANPFDVTVPDRGRHAALIALACAHPGREAARPAWEALPRWTQWTPDLADLLVARLSDLSDRSPWGAAVHALVGLVERGGGDAELIAAVNTLLRLDAADPTADNPELDRPAHRRLASLVESLIVSALRTDPGGDRQALAEAGLRLGTVEDPVHLGARLLVHVLPLERFGEICDLLAGQPGAARVPGDVAERVRRERPDPDLAFTTVENLAARGDLTGFPLAIGIADYGELLGWPTRWRDLVLDLRHHPDRRRPPRRSRPLLRTALTLGWGQSQSKIRNDVPQPRGARPAGSPRRSRVNTHQPDPATPAAPAGCRASAHRWYCVRSAAHHQSDRPAEPCDDRIAAAQRPLRRTVHGS